MFLPVHFSKLDLTSIASASMNYQQVTLPFWYVQSHVQVDDVEKQEVWNHCSYFNSSWKWSSQVPAFDSTRIISQKISQNAISATTSHKHYRVLHRLMWVQVDRLGMPDLRLHLLRLDLGRRDVLHSFDLWLVAHRRDSSCGLVGLTESDTGFIRCHMHSSLY